MPAFLCRRSSAARGLCPYGFGPTIGSAVNVTLLTYVERAHAGHRRGHGAIPDFEVFFDRLVAGFDEVLALGLIRGCTVRRWVEEAGGAKTERSAPTKTPA